MKKSQGQGYEKTGYEKYFQERRQQLRRQAQRQMRKSPQLWLISIATLLAGGCGWYLLGGGDLQAAHFLSRVEVNFLGEANAQDSGAATTDGGKTADDKQKSEAKGASDGGPDVKDAKAGPKHWTDEEVALFTKLDERKQELDTREASLSKLEEELQQQKAELEKKLATLEEVRGNISSKLEDKVKVDQAKVESLVSVYANMKPAQAAKIIESINEDLAVEVLAKMKNKAAAEILNLMDSDKAKKLSERFAGFREPASSVSRGTDENAGAGTN